MNGLQEDALTTDLSSLVFNDTDYPEEVADLSNASLTTPVIPKQEDQQEESVSIKKITPDDPRLLDSLEYQESKGNPLAVGPMTKYGTAKGPYQFIDSTWADIAEPGENVFDKVASRKNANKYLNQLYTKYDGDINLTLAAYNTGPGNVDNAIDKAGSKNYSDVAPYLPKQTQNYVPEILGRYNSKDPIFKQRVEQAGSSPKDFSDSLLEVVNTPEFQSLGAVDATAAVNKIYQRKVPTDENKAKLKEMSKAIWDAASPEELALLNVSIGRPERELFEDQPDPTKALAEWKNSKLEEFKNLGIAPELLSSPFDALYDQVSKEEFEAAQIRKKGFIGRFAGVLGGDIQSAGKGALDVGTQPAAFVARIASDALGVDDYSTSIAQLPERLLGDQSKLSKYLVDEKGYLLLSEDGSPIERWQTGAFRVVGNALASIAGGVGLKVAGAGQTAIATTVGTTNALAIANQTFTSVYAATGDKTKAYQSAFLTLPAAEIGSLFQLSIIGKYGTATTAGLSQLNKIKYFAKEAARDTLTGTAAGAAQDAIIQGAEISSTGQDFSGTRLAENAALMGVIGGVTGPVVKGLGQVKDLKQTAEIKTAVTEQLQDFANSHATDIALPVSEKFIDKEALEVLGQTVAGKDASGNVRVVKTGAIPEESITIDESLNNVTKYLTPNEVMALSQERGELLSKAKQEKLSDLDTERLSTIDQKLVGTDDPIYFNKVKANEADFIAKEKEAGQPSRGVFWDKDRGEWVNEKDPSLSDPFLKAALGLEQLEAPKVDLASTKIPKQSFYPNAIPQKPLGPEFTPRQYFSASNTTPMSPRRVVEATKKIMKLAAGKGATVKEGGRLGRNVLGYYSPANAIIRVRSLKDIPTFVHEVTHQVDHDLQDLVFREAALNPKVENALKEQAKTFYPNPNVNTNRKLALREGITKFLENYVIGEPVHKDLLDWWNTKFKTDQPEIHAQYEEVKNLTNDFYSQTLEARLQAFKSVDQPGVFQKLKEKFLSARTWGELVDKDFVFREADKITGRSGTFNNKGYRAFIDAADVSSRQYVTGLVNGNVFSDRQGNVIPEQKTLVQTVEGLTSEQQAGLEDGLIAYRAKAMIDQGKNPGISIDDVNQSILRYESRPDIRLLKQRQNEIYNWWSKTVDVLADGSPRMQKTIRKVREANKELTGEDHGYYVPFQRQGFEDSQLGATENGMVTSPTGINRSKGSDKPIQNIFDSFEKQAQKIGLAGLKNQLYDRLVRDHKNGIGLGNLIEKIPTKMQKKYETEYINVLQQSIQALKKDLGVNTSKDVYKFIQDLETSTGKSAGDILSTAIEFFGPETTLKSPTEGYVVLAMPKPEGKGNVFYEIHPDVAKAFNGVEQTGILASPVFDAIVRTPKRVLQAGATTLNPVFLVKNFFGRDWQSAVLLQEKGFHAGQFVKNLITEIGDQIATKATGRNTGAAAYAQRMGLNSATQAGAAKEIAYVARGKGLGSRIWRAGQTGLETLEWFSSISENTTRLAAMQTKADQLGITLDDKTKITPLQAIDLALAYKNATVNFSKRGKGTGVTYLRESIPFFGARLAATSQSIEMAGAAPKRAMALATTSFALGMYAYLNNAKKDWYDDLSPTTKANSFVIDVDNHVVAVPLDNFDAVFHGLGVMTAQQFVENSDNEASTLENLREVLDSASPIDLPISKTGVLGLASSPGGPLAKSALEQATNTKFWTGAPIVDDEHKAPSQQFTPKTSELIKQVGQELNMSPDRIEYFISTFAGGPLKMEKFFEQQMGFSPANKEEATGFFLRAFQREASNAAIQDQSRIKFYGAVAEANQNKYQETEPQGEARKLVNRTSKQISELNKQIAGEEDKEKRDLLYLQRRDLFKTGASAWRAVKASEATE